VAKLKEMRISIKFCFDIETLAPEIYELPSRKTSCDYAMRRTQALEGYLHFKSSQTSVEDLDHTGHFSLRQTKVSKRCTQSSKRKGNM